MARKIQQLSIDGVSVEVSKARFADTFDVAESDERGLAFDEEVVYVVVARVSTPSFRENRHGEVSRVNVLKVKEARLIKNDEIKTRILDAVGFDYRPQPSLYEGLGEPEEVDLPTSDDPSVEDLAGRGVRFVETEQTLLEDAGMPPDGPDDGPSDDDMAKFLELTRSLSDELDDDAEPIEEVVKRHVVADARGLRASDPLLNRFLEETPR